MTKLILCLIAFSFSSLASAQESAHCNPEDFIFSEDSQIEISIDGFGYSPRCLKVLPGTEITITASTGHPVEANQMEASPINPIEGRVKETRTYTFEEVGLYNYFCPFHHRIGMKGSIEVVE